MNAFESARRIEAVALQRMEPFIREITDGHFVLVDKGNHARHLQEEIGDLLANLRHVGPGSSLPNGELITIEIKAESLDRPNLFLETWSNRNLDNAISHAERGSNPGWLYKLRSDLLFYYFIDTDKLCIANVLELKRWAFAPGVWPVMAFDEKRQQRYQQMNDTWGRCVPIECLRSALGDKSFRVTTARQLAMFDSWDIRL